MDTKKCPKCGEIKNLSEFGIDRGRKDGHASKCKEYKNKYYLENREKFLEKGRNRYAENRNIILASQKRHRENDGGKYQKYQRAYYQANREHVLENDRMSREKRNNTFTENLLKQTEEDDQVLRKLREENKKKWAQYKIRAV